MFEPQGHTKRVKFIVVVFMAVFLASGKGWSEARADTAIAVEAGPDFTVGGSPKSGSTGFGVAGRLGYALGVPLLKVTPEIKVAFDALPDTLHAFRVMAGARLTVGALLAPVLFAHVGYGTLSQSYGDGLAYDAGVGLDFTLLPVIDLGIFGSFNRVVATDQNLDWMMIGVQAILSI